MVAQAESVSAYLGRGVYGYFHNEMLSLLYHSLCCLAFLICVGFHHASDIAMECVTIKPNSVGTLKVVATKLNF